MNVFVTELTCPTRQLIPDAVQDGHAVGVGGLARIQWQIHLLYNQCAGDRDGVYPFTISVQHLERLHIFLPKNGKTLQPSLLQPSGVIIPALDSTS